ncbi:MAG: sugar ABC transporter ATP-binding protein [Phototrophicales bacterium]|nr:MAG: sugar ABC transporter ATP-binding protein [Phototrophicales bacterium]
MADIIVENAYKTFGKVIAIKNVSLTVHDKEFVVLLGPSGCGKTTLLRAIAGLGLVDSGRIFIGKRDVTYLPPRDRNLAMVFQSYAIFPHIRVFDNIAFGLKMKRLPKEQIKERVERAAELLHIENLLDRYPGQMSGGQRQRVAVARAIAMQSAVLLMDEPLSNLDALLRLEMRAELKALLQQIGATTIYVTHDQIEALSMGDRIAVMNQGEILQFDNPTRVYDLPANHFVGGFIGNPPMNFLKGHVEKRENQVVVRLRDYFLTPSEQMQKALLRYEGQPIYVGIRAENMQAYNQPQPDALKVQVKVVEPLGAQNLITIEFGEDVLKISTHPDFQTEAGSDLWIRLPIDKIRWMDFNTGRAIVPDLTEAVAAD